MRSRRSVEYGPDLIENPWPFEVKLLPLTTLFADLTYQRPLQKPFIKSKLLPIDEQLVSVLDVADRDGTFAIMDGHQRFGAMQIEGREAAWCAVYTDMTVPDEARFFYHKNSDRKTVHPYYKFNARVVTGEPGPVAIQRIVAAEGFKLASGSGGENVITAIVATEDAFKYKSEARDESLSAALRLLRKAYFPSGRKGATDGEMIRGLGRFFQPFYDDEIDHDGLVEILQEVGPLNLIGIGTEKAARGGRTAGYEVARALLKIYNKDRTWKRLNPRMLERSGAR